MSARLTACRASVTVPLRWHARCFRCPNPELRAVRSQCIRAVCPACAGPAACRHLTPAAAPSARVVAGSRDEAGAAQVVGVHLARRHAHARPQQLRRHPSRTRARRAGLARRLPHRRARPNSSRSTAGPATRSASTACRCSSSSPASSSPRACSRAAACATTRSPAPCASFPALIVCVLLTALVLGPGPDGAAGVALPARTRWTVAYIAEDDRPRRPARPNCRACSRPTSCRAR